MKLVQQIIRIFPVVALTFMLSGCQVLPSDATVNNSGSKTASSNTESILSLKLINGKDALIGSIGIDTSKSVTKSKASQAVRKAISYVNVKSVGADTTESTPDPGLLVKIPVSAKRVAFLNTQTLIYLDGTDKAKGSDYATRLVSYELETDKILAIYEPKDGFSIDEYAVSPDKTLVTVWEIKLASDGRVLGGESRLTQIDLGTQKYNVVLGPQATNSIKDPIEIEKAQYALDPKVLVQYPLFYDSKNRLWMDTFGPNAGGLWGAGAKRMESDGSIIDLPNFVAGSYPYAPYATKNGQYILTVRPTKSSSASFAGIAAARKSSSSLSLIDVATDQDQALSIPEDLFISNQFYISEDGNLVSFVAYKSLSDLNDKKTPKIYLLNRKENKLQFSNFDSGEYLIGFSVNGNKLIVGELSGQAVASEASKKYLPTFSSYSTIDTADIKQKQKVGSSDFSEYIDVVGVNEKPTSSKILTAEIQESPNNLQVGSVAFRDDKLPEQRNDQQNGNTPADSSSPSGSTGSGYSNGGGVDKMKNGDCQAEYEKYAGPGASQSSATAKLKSDSIYKAWPEWCRSVIDMYLDHQESHGFTGVGWLQASGLLKISSCPTNISERLLYCLSPTTTTCLSDSSNVESGWNQCLDSPLYLYPTREMQVTVKPKVGTTRATFDLEKGFWDILVKPNGQMTADNKTVGKIDFDYPSDVKPLRTGYVVSQNNLEAALIDYAVKLGLSKQESSDFVSFWYSKLHNTSPFIQISHYSRQESDKIVDLQITPQPDTYIPIVMYFKKLTAPVLLQKPIFESIQTRTGFTAVEWSGVVQ